MLQGRILFFSQIWQKMPWEASYPIVPESWFMSLIGLGDVLPRADSAYHSLAGVQQAGISWQVGYQSCHTQHPYWQQRNTRNNIWIFILWCWVSFVGPPIDWYSASVPAIIYVVSYHIGPCYTSTWLYMFYLCHWKVYGMSFYDNDMKIYQYTTLRYPLIIFFILLFLHLMHWITVNNICATFAETWIIW